MSDIYTLNDYIFYIYKDTIFYTIDTRKILKLIKYKIINRIQMYSLIVKIYLRVILSYNFLLTEKTIIEHVKGTG